MKNNHIAYVDLRVNSYLAFLQCVAGLLRRRLSEREKLGALDSFLRGQNMHECAAFLNQPYFHCEPVDDPDLALVPGEADGEV